MARRTVGSARSTSKCTGLQHVACLTATRFSDFTEMQGFQGRVSSEAALTAKEIHRIWGGYHDVIFAETGKHQSGTAFDCTDVITHILTSWAGLVPFFGPCFPLHGSTLDVSCSVISYMLRKTNEIWWGRNHFDISWVRWLSSHR
jgi:hypothetical protein